MKVILFCGLPGSGKSYLARKVYDHYNRPDNGPPTTICHHVEYDALEEECYMFLSTGNSSSNVENAINVKKESFETLLVIGAQSGAICWRARQHCWYCILRSCIGGKQSIATGCFAMHDRNRDSLENLNDKRETAAVETFN